MKFKNVFSTVALLLVGIFFGVILVSTFGWIRPDENDVQIGASRNPVSEVNAEIKSFNDAFIQVAEKVTPSIVQVKVTTKRESDRSDRDRFFWFFPFEEDNSPRFQQSGGSGVIISGDGYILTNNHVVENATEVTVGLHDNRTFEAVVVGTDPLTDLAVIKIDASDLQAAFLGNSDDIRVGQWVMAIGNPLSLTSTVTAGIISAKSRNIDIIESSYGVNNFIQTDAAINPGNSGGALVDLTGAVIGINSAIYASRTGSFIGYGFAIPINLAKSVSRDLIANGKVTRGYIGVNIGPVDQATAKALGLERPRGIIIQGILEDGAAANEDIKEGDIILKIDGREVNQPNEFQSYVASLSAGTTVKLSLFRDGKEIERTVTLKPRAEGEQLARQDNSFKGEKLDRESQKEKNFDDIGLTVRNMTSSEKETYEISQGVMIAKVIPYSRAFNQRLAQGLVITEVDRQKVDSVAEFEDAVNNKKGDAVLLKLVDSKGNSSYIGMEIPK